MPHQTRTSNRRQQMMRSRANPRAAPNGRGAIGDPDVVAHPLDPQMSFGVDPGKALKFRIKVGPLFQRFRLAQTHVDRSAEIRCARIWRVYIAVELRCRITRLDLSN